MANSANDFNTAMNELQSLEAYVLSLWDYFNKFEEAGKKEDKNKLYQMEIKRVSRCNRRFDFDNSTSSANDTI